MDYLEELIENSDNIVVNYIQPKYSTKEQLISYAIGASVGLVCVGVIIGTGKLLDVAASAVYDRRQKLKNQPKKDHDLTVVK